MRIGPDAVFGRLWRELGIDRAINETLGGRRHKFDVERAVYHTVVHLLFESGSDRSSLVWREDFRLTGTEGLDLQHLYRAMISAKAIDFLESEGSSFSHILGVRLRKGKKVRERVLSRAGRYKVVETGDGRKSPMKVKDVHLDGRRYIVCQNDEQARKDRRDREAIVEGLRQALKRGDKSLVGNKNFRKDVKTGGGDRFAIDKDKMQAGSRCEVKVFQSAGVAVPPSARFAT